MLVVVVLVVVVVAAKVLLLLLLVVVSSSSIMIVVVLVVAVACIYDHFRCSQHRCCHGMWNHTLQACSGASLANVLQRITCTWCIADLELALRYADWSVLRTTERL